MGKFGRLAGAAAFAATVSGAQAQETNDNVVLAAMANDPAKAEISIPHPDGAIVMDVTRVALETRMEILSQLQECLQKGFEFADLDENGKLDDLEVYDFRLEGEWCAEDAVLAARRADAEAGTADAERRIAEAERGIADADARIVAANARQAEIQSEISALTDGLLEGARAEGG